MTLQKNKNYGVVLMLGSECAQDIAFEVTIYLSTANTLILVNEKTAQPMFNQCDNSALKTNS